MSAPSPLPEPASAPAPGVAWRPTRRALLMTAIAFAAGLLLFLLLWWDQRNGNDFYKAPAASRSIDGQQFEPLPAPLPAGQDDGSFSGLGRPDPGATAFPEIVEAPAPPPAPERPLAEPPPGATAGSASPPIPISSPAPRYPPAALRRGESGTVLLRVHVDAGGMPVAVDIVESSRSRWLDQAASNAVRRWRFRPAERGGQPVSGQVQVPISFNAGG